MEIEVISFRRVARPGPLKAYVDVRIGSIEIRNWNIVEAGNGVLKLHPPRTSWQDINTNEKRFSPLVSVPRDLKQQVDLAVLLAWERESENGQRQPQSE